MRNCDSRLRLVELPLIFCNQPQLVCGHRQSITESCCSQESASRHWPGYKPQDTGRPKLAIDRRESSSTADGNSRGTLCFPALSSHDAAASVRCVWSRGEFSCACCRIPSRGAEDEVAVHQPRRLGVSAPSMELTRNTFADRSSAQPGIVQAKQLPQVFHAEEGSDADIFLLCL